MNPYTDTHFFTFFWVLLKRLVTGPLPLASDEVQLLVLCGVACSCALVGTFLVLRQMAMMANALSHTLLLGIFVAFLIVGKELSLVTLLVASLVTGLVTLLLADGLVRLFKLQEDASIGLIFTALFSLGVVLVSLFSRNAHVGTELVMGNVDGLTLKDLPIVFASLGANLLVFTLLFKEFRITTFDPGLARTLGFSPLLFNYLLMVLASATLISAFRAVGVLMVLAFLITPVLIARLWVRSLGPLLVVSSGIGIGASLMGVALSRHLLTYFGVGLSTGGLVVCVLGLAYLLAILFAPKGKLRYTGPR